VSTTKRAAAKTTDKQEEGLGIAVFGNRSNPRKTLGVGKHREPMPWGFGPVDHKNYLEGGDSRRVTPKGSARDWVETFWRCATIIPPE